MACVTLTPRFYDRSTPLVVDTSRIAAKRQTAGITFNRRPKIGIIAQQGRLVAPIHVKLGRLKIIGNLFDGLDDLYHHAKLWEDRL